MRALRSWLARHRFWVRVLLLLALVPVLTAAAVALYYGSWALAFDLDKVRDMPATSFVYDRHGYVIQRLYSEHRIPIKSTDIPEVLRHAILAKEDARFYWHPGFDPIAIVRSLGINAARGQVATGASTITQQLARNSAGMFERTLDRKLKELALAVRIELAFSKDEILTAYLNRILFGGHVYGAGAAADAYFGKHPRDLTLDEAALLAGIVASPNNFSPWRDAEKARAARDFTLDRMVDAGFLKPQQAASTKKIPLRLRPLMDLPGTYLTSLVREFLPEFVTQDLLLRGGLHIHTTIDLGFQQHAEDEIREGLRRIERMPGYAHPPHRPGPLPDGLPPAFLQAAFVALSNEDGGILALVGGRDYEQSPFNRALESRRQVGSTIKPFVYAHAFNLLNYTAFTEIDHSPFDLTTTAPDTPLTGPAPQWITVREAVETSDNYAAMRTGLACGPDTFSSYMSQVVRSPVPPNPSSFLGACEFTPLEFASAYTIFPNYGVQLRPHLIREIRTTDGVLLFRHIDERARVLAAPNAYQIHHLLAGVVDRGTARSLRTTYGFTGDWAGKTGTTNAYKDSWFAGYSSEVTAVIWVGLDRPVTILPGGYASRLALPIWAGIMKESAAHYPPRPMLPPPGIQLAQRKEQKRFLWVFKSTKVSGPSEYIRDDQREQSLTRLGPHDYAGAVPMAEKSLLGRLWDWVRGPDDQFQSTANQTGSAEVRDTFETVAPEAEPIP